MNGQPPRKLNYENRTKLTIWLDHNRDKCEGRTYKDVAGIAGYELGFPISDYTTRQLCQLLGIKAKRVGGGQTRKNNSELAAEIAGFEKQVKNLESTIEILTDRVSQVETLVFK